MKNFETGMPETPDQSEQLALQLDVRPTRIVSWFSAVQTEKKRRLFKNRLRTELLLDPDSGMPRLSSIPVDDIPNLTDPSLRYALRLADATDAIGWIPKNSSSKSRHDVWVEATDEGFDSKFLGANYTGITEGQRDTFIENLYLAEHEA